MTTTHTDRTQRPFVMDEGIALLARTPGTLDAMLRGLPDGWINANEGDSSWSPFDVVGHLIHGERTDWMPRVRIVLEHGEGRAFDTLIASRSSPRRRDDRSPACSMSSRRCARTICAS